MAIHNQALPGQIAETVLMPGDPLRAKYIAEKYLKDAVCVNTVRNMLGYTGTYRGKRITVLGSGMGVPSMGIYSYELYKFYGVKNIIRIGSCGAYSPDLELRDIILATGSYYEGAYARQVTGKRKHFAYPDPWLNDLIARTAREQETAIRKGLITSVEGFDPYLDDPSAIMKRYKRWWRFRTKRILGSEMESFALFLNAKLAGRRAACLATVADSSFKPDKLTPEERQLKMDKMIELALETAYKL